MRFVLVCVTWWSQLPALTTDPVTVLKVIDGDSLLVEGTVGGVPAPIAVRLLQVNTPEMRDKTTGQSTATGRQARQFVQELLPEGARVQLWGPRESLRADGHGRVLAVVVLADGTSIQEHLIAAGWSVYWRRYGSVRHDVWHESWLQLAAEAQAAGRGMWELDPQWMRTQMKHR
jgi:endonuclease YncB( thermonuclease family)